MNNCHTLSLQNSIKFQFIWLSFVTRFLTFTKVTDLSLCREFQYLEIPLFSFGNLPESYFKNHIILRMHYLNLARTTVETGKDWQYYIQSFIQQRFIQCLLNTRHYFRNKSQQKRQKSLLLES